MWDGVFTINFLKLYQTLYKKKTNHQSWAITWHRNSNVHEPHSFFFQLKRLNAFVQWVTFYVKFLKPTSFIYLLFVLHWDKVRIWKILQQSLPPCVLSGLCLLAVVVMYLMWVQVLDTLEQFALHQRVLSCPSFHLSVQHGPSFLLAPAAVFFCLLAGLLFILIGRRVQEIELEKRNLNSWTFSTWYWSVTSPEIQYKDSAYPSWPLTQTDSYSNFKLRPPYICLISSHCKSVFLQ